MTRLEQLQAVGKMADTISANTSDNPLDIDWVQDESRWDRVENIDIFCANIAQKTHTKLNFTTPILATILLTNDARILELNSQFRNQNKPTNVLSFPSGEEEPDHENGKLYLGDIAISFETVSREAAEAQKTLNHHLTHMIVHGILHLLGYDHETDEEAEEMERLEIEILHELDISDPYAVR